MAHDVFVSYSAKDKATADAVCATLEGRGIRFVGWQEEVCAQHATTRCILPRDGGSQGEVLFRPDPGPDGVLPLPPGEGGGEGA